MMALQPTIKYFSTEEIKTTNSVGLQAAVE